MGGKRKMATGVERFQKTTIEEGNMMHTGREKNKAKGRKRTRNAIETGIKSEGKQKEKATESGKVIVLKSGIEAQGGCHFENYNQNVYEGKTGVDILETVTPYAEFLYKFSRKKSARFEFQYMLAAPGISTNPETNEKYTNRDFGDWIFGQVEIGLAPHWIITASDMYNVSPYKKNLAVGEKAADLHYPTLGVVYTYRSNRFEMKYVKQVEGIVCAGGICRLEPAFSGMKMSVRSTF